MSIGIDFSGSESLAHLAQMGEALAIAGDGQRLEGSVEPVVILYQSGAATDRRGSDGKTALPGAALQAL